MSAQNALDDAYVTDPIMVPSWSFGDRLRKARLMRKMDQRSLAQELSVSAGAIAQWETDAARPRDIAHIARMVQDVCRVPAWWLLDIDPITVMSSADELSAARARRFVPSDPRTLVPKVAGSTPVGGTTSGVLVSLDEHRARRASIKAVGE